MVFISDPGFGWGSCFGPSLSWRLRVTPPSIFPVPSPFQASVRNFTFGDANQQWNDKLRCSKQKSPQVVLSVTKRVTGASGLNTVLCLDERKISSSVRHSPTFVFVSNFKIETQSTVERRFQHLYPEIPRLRTDLHT